MQCSSPAVGVIICGPGPYRRHIGRCQACRRRRRLVVSYGMWGSDERCTGCGGYWQDGVLLLRGSRAERRIIARRVWAAAGPKWVR